MLKLGTDFIKLAFCRERNGQIYVKTHHYNFKTVR